MQYEDASTSKSRPSNDKHRICSRHIKGFRLSYQAKSSNNASSPPSPFSSISAPGAGLSLFIRTGLDVALDGRAATDVPVRISASSREAWPSSHGGPGPGGNGMVITSACTCICTKNGRRRFVPLFLEEPSEQASKGGFKTVLRAGDIQDIFAFSKKCAGPSQTSPLVSPVGITVNPTPSGTTMSPKTALVPFRTDRKMSHSGSFCIR